MAQCLMKSIYALPKDQGLTPSTHMTVDTGYILLQLLLVHHDINHTSTHTYIHAS